MTAITSSLVVKLIDAISGPAKGAAKSLASIGDAARRLNGIRTGDFANRLGEAAKRNAEHMDALRGKMVDAAAMGYGLARALSAPYAEARAFESILLDIGQKADLTDAQIGNLGKKIGNLSEELRKVLSQGDLAKGVDFLAGMGLDPDKALTMLEPIGRAAHAYKANVEDLSRAGYAAFDNLKVPAEEFARALDIMAQSGKEGAFELRDMAQYFPTLGAGFQALKQKGVGAVADLSAALQITRKGAGDSAEAANNLANLIAKIVAPDAVKKFREFGIDIRAELEKAQSIGASPIEMIALQTKKALKGNLSNISDLFQDMQVQRALLPLIMNMEEYRRIRAEALQAEGVVNNDFARRLLTGDAALEQFKNRMADLGRTIGAILLPTINGLLKDVGEWASSIADLADRHPGMTKAVIVLSAALIGFRTAAIAAAFASRFMLGGLLSGTIGAVGAAGKMKGLGALMFAPFLAFGTRIKGILQTIALRFRLARAAGIGFGRSFVAGTAATMARALLSLLAPIAILRGALRLLRLAMIGTGLGAALVALGLLGEWIASNWEGIGVAFEAFSGAFMREIAPVKENLRPVIEAFSSLFDKVDSLTGALGNSTWAQWGITAGRELGGLVVTATQTVGDIVSAFRDLPNRIGDLVRGIGEKIRSALFDVDYSAAGASIISAVWEGMKDKMSELASWIRSSIAAAFSGIGGGFAGAAAAAVPRNSAFSAPGVVDVPVGGGSGAPPARARGGHVKAGRLYQVNDDGTDDPTELFMPGKSGTVLPSSQRKKLGGGGGGSSSRSIKIKSIVISGQSDPQATWREFERQLSHKLESARDGLFSDDDLRN